MKESRSGRGHHDVDQSFDRTTVRKEISASDHHHEVKMPISKCLRPGDRLVLATHNRDKFSQLSFALARFDLTLLGAAEFGMIAPEEVGESFTDIALLKASACATASGIVSLGDDGGFCINALDGAPGVRSSDWASKGDYGPAIERIGQLIAGATPSDTRARFTTALALAWPDGSSETLEASTAGYLTWPPRGKGADYDPIFVPEGASLTAAEAEQASPLEGVLNRRSYLHRASAAEALVASVWTDAV